MFLFCWGAWVCFSGEIDSGHFLAMAYKITCPLASSHLTGFSSSCPLSSSHKGPWSRLWSYYASSNHRAFAHTILYFWNTSAGLLYLVTSYTAFKLPNLSFLQESLPLLSLWINQISLLFVLTALYFGFIALTPAVVSPYIFGYLNTVSLPLRM